MMRMLKTKINQNYNFKKEKEARRSFRKGKTSKIIMFLKENESLRCPKCGGKEFIATAHVTQDWVIDSSGDFVSCENDCVEKTHEPALDDIIDCKACGYSAEGTEFLVAEEG